MPKERRVVITGYGMVTPLGVTAEETFERASRGESGIGYIKAFDTTGLACRVGGEVDDGRLLQLEMAQGLGKLGRYLSRGTRFMRAATHEAATQAGLGDIAERRRIGVALGSHGDNSPVEDIMRLHRFYDGERWDYGALMAQGGYDYMNFFRRKSDVATAAIAMLFDLKGPTHSVVSACSAGPQAIGEACYMIRQGVCDAMVAGGCDSQLNFVGFTGFVLITALCEKYTTPQSASRPFDRKRSGFVMGEGAGALVLEELGHAKARGAEILGEVLGYGSSADAYRITDPHPKGMGAAMAMRAAMEDAGLGPEDIDYINAHGTSTQANDATETRAIREVFGDRAMQVPASSNKSMLGHTIGAAGAIECILTLMGIERSLLLPTINYENPDPKCNLDYVPNEARPYEHRRAMSNSFGFGGQNACLVVGGFER